MPLGPFDDFFDMDHDGKLDTFEKGMKMAYYASLAEQAAKDDTDYSFRRRRRRSSYSDEPKYNYNNDNDEGFLDSSNFHCDRPTQVAFNPDGTYNSEVSKYDGGGPKTFEDDYVDANSFSDRPTQVSFNPDGTYSSLVTSLNEVTCTKISADAPSEAEEKPSVTPPAAVNTPKSEIEIYEKQLRRIKTRKTIILIIASLLVIGLAYAIASAAIHKNHIAQIEDYCIKQAKIVSYRYDLDFEKVELHENFGELSGSYSADYYLNGMHTLEYRQMYDLGDKLWCLHAPCGSEHVLVFLNLICSDGDEYKIYTSTRSIDLNGKKVDNDFFNSESYKEIHPKKSSTSGAKTHYNGTPYVGMYVSPSGYSGWINSGTDYDTCDMTTTKYSYKTDDAYYVIWVNPKTNLAVKILGGPSGKNVKKPTYSSSYDEDEYNAKDYSNAEDFYDDNYYDFFDYYDAEDYYNEHCD